MAGEILDIIVSPVCVVTAKSKDKINGMSLAWIMQGAFNPAYVVVSIAPQRYTYSLIKESKIFGVNILSDAQLDLGRHFGFSSGKTKDKFKDIKYTLSGSGVPIIDSIYAYIECKLINSYNAGDHDLLVGELVDKIIYKSKKPLIFKSSDYF